MQHEVSWVMTHCMEAWNLSTAPFHSLYFRFSHISLSLYGFRDHPRMPSNYGCYQISNRLSLNSVYYQKTPWIIIKMYEKKWEFWQDSELSLFWAPKYSKRGYMKVHLSYPIKDMSYASIADDRAWPFESTGPTVGWSNW